MTTSREPNPLDPVLSEKTVLSLARLHVPGATAVTAVDESGGEARAYMIDDDVVLNTQRPHRVRPRTSLEKYAFFLDQLTDHTEIVVPRKLGHGREGTIEYLCMTRIPGTAILNNPVDGPERKEVLRTLGRTLGRIHQVPQGPFRESGLFPETNPEDAFADAVEAIHNARIDWTLGSSPREVADRALAVLPPSDETAALHSNPGPIHVFVDPETSRFSGLIDFGDAYISHPALDMRVWGQEEDRAALLEGYSDVRCVDDSFMTTSRVGLVLSAMSSIRYRPERAAQAQQRLGELLVDF